MTFTSIEMSAIAKLALAMAGADGKVDKSELTYIALEMTRFGVKDAEPILNGADEMDPTIALSFDNLELLCDEHHNQEHKSKTKRYSFDANGRVIEA